MKIDYLTSDDNKVEQLKCDEEIFDDNYITKLTLDSLCKLYHNNEIIFSSLTDIGVLNLLEDGTLTNTDSVTITGVPLNLEAYNDAISRSISLYGDYGCQMMSYELLVQETNKRMSDNA